MRNRGKFLGRNEMARVVDVAEYILRARGPMSAWKLQKLVYYSQAWHSVWEDEPLFEERIEAWANGPVVRDLYDLHAGKFTVRTVGGNADRLNEHEAESVDVVLNHYGKRSSQYLSDLTHMEDPWKLARQGVPEGARSNNEITLEAISEYYSSLV